MLATKLIDGKARADRLLADVAAAAASLRGGPGIVPGLCAGAGRRRSGERGLRPQQGQGGDRGRHCELSSTSCPETTSEAELLALDRHAQRRRRRSTASSCSCRCRSRSTRSAVIDAIDPAKDVDGFHPDNVGRLVERRPSARPVHAATAADAAARPRCRAWQAPRRSCSAARTSSASRWRQLLLSRELHGDAGSFAQPRPPGDRAPGRHPRRRGRTAAIRARRLDQARRHRHRRRHQPGRGRRTARPKLVGDVDFAEARSVAARDHPGARRRRPDDDRLPAAQHADRRLPAARASRAGNLEPGAA